MQKMLQYKISRALPSNHVKYMSIMWYWHGLYCIPLWKNNLKAHKRSHINHILLSGILQTERWLHQQN